MTLVDLAGHLSVAKSDGPRWRFVADFLEEYRHKPAAERATLLADEPPGTGDARWDVFLAALSPSIGPRATAEGSPRGRAVGKSGAPQARLAVCRTALLSVPCGSLAA